MTAHRQHGHGKRPARDARAAERGKRSSTGAPTGAIIRPAMPSRRQRGDENVAAANPSGAGRRNRYGENGVASLGEARAHQRLRKHAHAESPRAPKPPSRRDARRRDRRTIKTTKPLLVTRFGAGRPRFRLVSTLVVLLLVIGAVLAKVGLMQGGRGQALRASADALWTRDRVIPATRGSIFDRNGDELALSVPAATVAVNPQQVEDVAGTMQILGQLIGLTPERTAELQADIEASDNGFLYIARQIDPAIADQIAELELLGVTTYAEDRRIMPGGETGQSVIGDTDIDGNGIAGLELQFGSSDPLYSNILSGTPGEMTLEVAPGGRTIAGSEEIVQPAIAGTNIVTTIDRSVQYATEQALLRQVNTTGAIGGQVIVMDTDTGDIIAMATVVRRDGVAVVSSGNWSAVGAYEPGSVGKIITLAGALEDNAVEPTTSWVVPDNYDCTIDPTDQPLTDAHPHDPVPMSIRDILVESSNVGTILTSRTIGYERMGYYLNAFGLGEVSDLGFPGESAGILKPSSEWEGTERCTVAYGQGLAATPVQLVSAVNVIANDGTYVAPRLVMGTVAPDGEINDAAPSETRSVVSEETANQMQTIMRDVVCDSEGTAIDARVPGLSVAGKTGTAYKAQDDGTYFNEDGFTRDYYSSFVGFFPAEDPQVTILISIDEPQTGFNSGAQSAAPLFRELAPTMVHELEVESPPGSTGCDGS